MRRYAGESDEIGKKRFSRILSHDRYWENKTHIQDKEVYTYLCIIHK